MRARIGYEAVNASSLTEPSADEPYGHTPQPREQ
jgi:hypothetical protein